MKFSSLPIDKITLFAAVMLTMFLCCGCNNSKFNAGEISETDIGVSSEVSSETYMRAEDAVEIYADENVIYDVFLMKSYWNREEYQNENSLNQLMTVEYMSSNSAVPQAANSTEITFKFAGDEKPQFVKLTQQANTFKVNTGIPYDIKEVELSKNSDDDYCFTVDFEQYPMYYYTLDCEWSSGNTAQYAFALERVN